MSSERPEEISKPPASTGGQVSADRRESDTGDDHAASKAATSQQATVLVRGETIRNEEPNSPPKDSAPRKDSSGKDNQARDKEKSSRNEVSQSKVKMQNRLPALDDDADRGVQKELVVTRDGKADLAFTGTLVASAAPQSALDGEWQEYRIYETNGGKHVFSKITRNVLAEKQDAHEAEVFDPAPSSMPSQLLRSARDLARSHPLTWTDAAAAFFGYDPLAKTLYRKLSGQFEERIS